MGKISLNNIAEELAIKSNITREAADSFMHAFIATIEKGLQEDNMVKIKGLGTFKLLPVSDRSSVDVNTGERITIKGHNKVSFTPDSAMKELVNRPFAHFEPTELNDGYPSDENDELQDAGVSDENDDVEVLEPATTDAAPLTNEVTELPEPIVSVEKSVVEIVEEETATEKIEPETIVASVEEDEPTVPSTPTEQECAVLEEVASEEVAPAETPEIETAEVVIPEDVAPEKEILEEEVTDEVTTEAIAHEETLSAEADVDSETPAHEEEVDPQTVAQEEVAPVASAHEEKPAETAEATDATEAITKKGSVTPKKEQKKRGGCVWGILLILLVAMGVAYWFLPLAVFEKQAHEEELIENNDIVVKPNLEEELGVEWGDEPKVEVELSVKEELLAPTPVEEPAPISTDVVVESPKYQGVKTTPEVPNAKFCSVTITESLDAKTIKDITPADTTDYLMEGTLVTHQLKRGETLILLSKKYYGDKRLWPYIVKYNWMKDFNHVAIGQMVNIPVLKDKPME